MSARKILSQIRKLLASNEWPSIQQGIVLAAGITLPEVRSAMTAGISISGRGELSWARDSEVVKRVSSTWRAQAALDIAARFGLLSDGAALVLPAPQSGQTSTIADLSALTGLPIASLDLTRVTLAFDDNGATTPFLQPLADSQHLHTLLIRGGYQRTGAIDIAPLVTVRALKKLNIIRFNLLNSIAFAQLSSIEDLCLDSTSITDLTPLAGLKSLQKLSLSGCKITDLKPLSGLDNLQTLSLPDDGNGLDLTPLRGMTALASTATAPKDLWRALVIAPERFAETTSVTIVNTRYSSYSAFPPSFAPLQHLKKLQKLEVSLEKSCTDIESLASITTLTSLTIHGGYKTEVMSLDCLASMPDLTFLTLKKLILSPSALAAIGAKTGLKSLILEDCTLPSLAFLGTLTGLQRLSLHNSKPSMTWDFSVLRGLHGLRTMGGIDASGQSRLQGLSAYVWLWSMLDADLSGLRTLNLSGIRNIKLRSMEPLTGCPQLQTLKLGGTTVTDHSILATFTDLESLELCGTDRGDLSCLIPLKKLKDLDLSGGTEVSVKPSKVHLDNHRDVTAYRQKLARALKRDKNRTPQQDAWLATMTE